MPPLVAGATGSGVCVATVALPLLVAASARDKGMYEATLLLTLFTRLTTALRAAATFLRAGADAFLALALTFLTALLALDFAFFTAAVALPLAFFAPDLACALRPASIFFSFALAFLSMNIPLLSVM